ncbi:polysaccharide biosynthesis protein [Paenibacillus sp. GCM10027628]|uniref:polysaccharide biosynthesis protein n=1 Tax=Paenibacillus sp. GCM10027628 TaxID=3273413 RepID=UPI00363947EC
MASKHFVQRIRVDVTSKLTKTFVPLFKQQLEQKQDLSVTDPRMTRFFCFVHIVRL